MRVGFSQVSALKPYGYLLGSIIEYNKYEESDKKEDEEAGRIKSEKATSL